MPYSPFREAGLPQMTDDVGGGQGRYGFSKGVVRAVYPQEWRVDIESEEGGLITKALVLGDVLPEIHVDTANPQHVVFTHLGGRVMDPICWVLPFRRMQGPTEPDDGHERHYYQKNQQVIRIKDITIRVTPDNRIFVWEAENNDYLLYDMNTRTVHAMAPHIFLGSDTETRYEYHRGEEIRMVTPKALVGEQAVENTDGITYLAQQLIHLLSAVEVKATAGEEINLIAPLIKLTAQAVVVDPVSIRFGHANATERLILGDLWKAFYNVFIALFNSHSHTNVQNGPGSSGPPVVPASPMDDTTLSTIARISQ
jgi:hypothetical protein